MISFYPELNVKIAAGLNHAADCVKLTAGPKGRNVAFDPVTDVPYIINNGKDIIRHVKFTDKEEHIGADLIREAMDKVYYSAGDGAVLTSILIQAIMSEV